jgi:putative SOS response-associated peptidase YedK
MINARSETAATKPSFEPLHTNLKINTVSKQVNSVKNNEPENIKPINL